MGIDKSISVIIPNYNGRHLLAEYLPYTLSALGSCNCPFEIIVADDCSADDSIDFLEAQYPEIILIKNSVNRGFSFTCNRGIEAARNNFILLLNSDVKLEPNYFDQQWKYFALPGTFGVMGRIIDMVGDNVQDSARMLRNSGFKIKTQFYYSDTPGAIVPTIYLSGANAFVAANKLKEIGGFDELFSPFYGEDLELCLRAWRLGWKCYYEHQAVCRHQVSASTAGYQTANWVKTIYFRNRFFVHGIHLNGIRKTLWMLQIIFDLFSKAITGQFWIFNSYRAFFSSFKAVRSSRKKFDFLMKEKHSNRSVGDVAREFSNMIVNMDIKKP